MFYLILAILSSTGVSLMMRLSNGRAQNRTSMLAANYVVCSLLAALFMGQGGLLPGGEGQAFALGLGAVSGLLYLAGFVFFQWNVQKNGMVLPSTFMKLGVLVPTVMAIVVFRESPSLLQIIGMGAAIAAILLIQLEKGGEKSRHTWALVALLLCCGASDATSKIYSEWGVPALENQYLLYTFASAFLLCLVLCVLRKESVAWVDVLCGALIGIPNYFSARFLLLSLGSIPAVAAYPIFSVGTLIVVTLLGVLLFKEKLSLRQKIALVIILAALALLNL